MRIIAHIPQSSQHRKCKYVALCRKRSISHHKDNTCYHRGGILIEFVFSIPIVITLIFFVNDHYRFFELKNKLKSSAYLVASMVQNINNVKSDKQLTLTDIKMICFASSLNLFYTNSMFPPYPIGIKQCVYFHYVKRISRNEYKVQQIWTNAEENTTSVNTIRGGMTSGTNLQTWELSKVIDRCSGLECFNDGEERLLINVWYDSNVWLDPIKYQENAVNRRLGLFILRPIWGRNGYQTDNKGNFSYLLVITPKPGLFPIK